MTSKLTYMGTIGLAAFSCVAAAPAFAAAGTTAPQTAPTNAMTSNLAPSNAVRSNLAPS